MGAKDPRKAAPRASLSLHQYPQLLQLFVFDRIRGVNHHIAALVVFGECDEVADRVGAVHHRAEAVEAERDTAVGWRTVFECAEQKAELGLGLLGREAEQAEVAALQVAVVDPDGAAADLYTVQHEVVRIGTDAFE